MSALDQAFIKAFAKEPTIAQRSSPRAERVNAPAHTAGEPTIFDQLYDAGTFYRVDAAAERAVPAAHVQPEQKTPRRMHRRAHRPEVEQRETPAPVAQPEPHPDAVPPRRHWSRSMLDIARQLARIDSPHALSSELTPEIIFAEPPLPEPAEDPVVPAEQQDVAVAETIELPDSPPQAIAELWPVHGAIVAQATLISLADAETWLAAPMAPAVTCYEQIADDWSPPSIPAAAMVVSESRFDNLEASFKATITAEVAAPTARSKRKLRFDSSHARVPVPHRKPAVEVHDVAPSDVITSDVITSDVITSDVITSDVVSSDVVPADAAIAVEPVGRSEAVVRSDDNVKSEDNVTLELAPRLVTVETEPAPIADAAKVVDSTEVQVLVTETVEEVAVAATPAEAAVEAPAPTLPKRPYIPLWEVDCFTWPALCDKLMHDPNGYFASASNKLLSVVSGGLKVLGITGSRRGEGRTTLALCLARAAAQAGIHVALVDADFTRPQLASMLGLETAYGWQEAATGKIPLSEAAVKSLADRLTVLPLEVSTSTAKLSLADPRVTATLRATAATFDLVIVDLGPLNSSAEPLFPPGENCPLDAAVVVRDTRYALVNESRTVGDRLYDAGIEAVGIAENFVTQPEMAFL